MIEHSGVKLYGVGSGPAEGPESMLDALWCNIRPILRGGGH